MKNYVLVNILPFRSGMSTKKETKKETKKKQKAPSIFGSGAFLHCRVRRIVHFRPTEHHKTMSEDK